MSIMGCRLLRLDGANVLHGLGVARGILQAYHGLFSWSTKLVSEKKLASTPIAENPTWEYVTNILRSPDNPKKIHKPWRRQGHGFVSAREHAALCS